MSDCPERQEPAQAGSRQSLRTATRGGAIFAAATLFSRLLGLLRESAAARLFGAGRERDLYLLAHAVAFQSVTTIVTAANAAVLPVLAWAVRSGEHAPAGMVAAVAATGPVVLAGAVAVFFGARPLGTILSGRAEPSDLGLLSRLLRVSIWYVPAAGLANIAVMLPLADQRYPVPAIAYAIPNTAVLGVLAATYRRLGIMALAAGDLAGGILFAALVWAYVWWRYLRGRRVRPDWTLARRAGVLAVPPLLQSLATMSAALLERSVMARLKVGLLSAYDYARVLMNVAVGALLAGPITVVASFLAYEAGRRDPKMLARRVEQALAGVLVLAVFGASLLVANAQLVIAVLYRGMKFGEAAAQATGALVSWHAAPTLATTVADVLARTCNALHDTLSPAVAWIAGQLLRTALIPPLGRSLGGPGVALAHLCGALTVAVALAATLRRRNVRVPWLAVLGRGARLAAVAAVAAGAVALLPAQPGASMIENLALLVGRGTLQLAVFAALVVFVCPFERDLFVSAARHRARGRGQDDEGAGR